MHYGQNQRDIYSPIDLFIEIIVLQVIVNERVNPQTKERTVGEPVNEFRNL